ncbi:hypothetical protein TNIN_235111 [Trichonephila inaurata madagascariensis]|uniref:Uncharacterized protein n=1 Tax=Trichonephila inaurata madagascariensis TaxID=2747483 RepID=A0A8X7CR48_9ARAC|nr:hypothetical protein TNIN_235111 [Trichonephila inaurata madagascariensis]
MSRKVEYWSRSQSSKFIGQVIEINEFYHRKYLTKSPLGDYYTFPAIDDEGCVEIFLLSSCIVFTQMIAMADLRTEEKKWFSVFPM